MPTLCVSPSLPSRRSWPWSLSKSYGREVVVIVELDHHREMPRLRDEVIRSELLEVARLDFALDQMEEKVVIAVELNHHPEMFR